MKLKTRFAQLLVYCVCCVVFSFSRSACVCVVGVIGVVCVRFLVFFFSFVSVMVYPNSTFLSQLSIGGALFDGWVNQSRSPSITAPICVVSCVPFL